MAIDLPLFRTLLYCVFVRLLKRLCGDMRLPVGQATLSVILASLSSARIYYTTHIALEDPVNAVQGFYGTILVLIRNDLF
jgi:hypothetical protein